MHLAYQPLGEEGGRRSKQIEGGGTYRCGIPGGPIL